MCQAPVKFNLHDKPRGVSYSYAHFTDAETEAKEVNYLSTITQQTFTEGSFALDCILQYMAVFQPINVK